MSEKDTPQTTQGAVPSDDPILNRRNASPQDLQRVQSQMISSLVKDAHAVLVTGPAARKKLPEQIFKSTFLPMFAGQETHPDITVGVWISIAGTPFAEVDIIDEQGQTLFSVPPIFERSIVDSTKGFDVPLSVVSDTVEKMMNQSPARATAFLYHHLDQVITDDATLIKWRDAHADAMDKIFARYGITPVVTSRSTTAVQQKPNDEPKPDLIYGEIL